MKKRCKLIMLMVALLLTVSCASGVKFSELKPELAPADSEKGRIFFYRPSGVGFALRPEVHLNEEVVGQAVAKGFFFVDRPPGDYEVVISTEVERKTTFVLEKGQTRFIRLAIRLGFFVGHIFGELVDEPTGLAEIQNCKYLEEETPAE